MPPDTPSTDAALLHAIADASRRLTRTQIEDFLVTRGFYSLSTLRADPTYGSLGKRELLDVAFEERGRWELTQALADEGAFSEEALTELRRAGFLEDASTDQSTPEGKRLHQDNERPASQSVRMTSRPSQKSPPRHGTAGVLALSSAQTRKDGILVAFIGALALVVVGIIGYFAAIAPVQISIHATQTAEKGAETRSSYTLTTALPSSTTSPATQVTLPALPEAAILSPRSGDVVSLHQLLEGSVSSIPPGIRVFLCVRASAPGGLIYPQGEIDSSGEWEMMVTFQTSRAAYETYVVAASTQEASTIMAEGHFALAGMAELPPDVTMISAAVAVTRD